MKIIKLTPVLMLLLLFLPTFLPWLITEVNGEDFREKTRVATVKQDLAEPDQVEGNWVNRKYSQKPSSKNYLSQF